MLCQIDIHAKLKEMLSIDFPRYVILGICNPQLAHHALKEEIDISLLLPCNCVVYEQGATGAVGAVDAVKMLSVTGKLTMEPLAQQVSEKLRRAIDQIRG